MLRAWVSEYLETSGGFNAEVWCLLSSSHDTCLKMSWISGEFETVWCHFYVSCFHVVSCVVNFIPLYGIVTIQLLLRNKDVAKCSQM
jgi:hypothetical protein